ncbi:DUF4169 family protein, partial [Rhizobium johnstonii]|uniref:DUF4169 family protein n=1 Tax=Rhizobium johnstonii TaxID=3019933 RepID=UPI003F98737E
MGFVGLFVQAAGQLLFVLGAAEIINLRQFRKKQARSEKEKQAEQNRISFGR